MTFKMSLFDECNTEIVENNSHGAKIQELPADMFFTLQYKTLVGQLKNDQTTKTDRTVKQKIDTKTVASVCKRDIKSQRLKNVTNNVAYEINNWLMSLTSVPNFLKCGQSNPQRGGNWITFSTNLRELTDEEKKPMLEFMNTFNNADTKSTVRTLEKHKIIELAKKNVMVELKLTNNKELMTKYIDNVQLETKRLFLNHNEKETMSKEIESTRTQIILDHYGIKKW